MAEVEAPQLEVVEGPVVEDFVRGGDSLPDAMPVLPIGPEELDALVTYLLSDRAR